MRNDLFPRLQGGMIVSCQAEGADPFNKPEYIALFAKAAEMGGACGIRTEGIAKLKAIKETCSLPVIGLLKTYFKDGFVRITGSWDEVCQLLAAGSDIIAIDGTFRTREGLAGPDFIKTVKTEIPDIIILADIATYEEALACEAAGADCISTTLSGYTPETQKFNIGPDFNLIESLSRDLHIPIFAEGRINTPAEAAEAMRLGAFAVITGTAISRPRVITQWFVDAIRDKQKQQ